MSKDNNISFDPRDMDVESNTPVNKGFKKPNVDNVGMSPPFDLNLSFQGIAANDSDSDSESIRNEAQVARESCVELKSKMVDLLGKVYAPSACHAILYQLNDPEAGNLLQQIISFEKEYKDLLDEYASSSATVASLEPDNKVEPIEPIDPNVLGLQVWQSTKDKINSKMLADASIKHDKQFVDSKSSNVEDLPSVHDKQVSSRQTNLDANDNMVKQVFSIAEKPTYILETPTDWRVWAIKTQHWLGITNEGDCTKAINPDLLYDFRVNG
jgi:hypothetical protein